MSDCIFCKIVAGEIPAYKVYEDEDYLAFLDIEPCNPGHTLLIPKKHYRWVWDSPDVGNYYGVAGKIANAIRKAYNTEFVISLAVGIDVPHAHVWLVPRFEGDGHENFIDLKNRKKLSAEEMIKAMEKIKKAL
jgi:histidine triad (HIT) family protein